MSTERCLQDWLDYIRTVHFRSIDMTLDRVREVLGRMEDPFSFRVIAVAGTNGKGSCAAMLGSLLRACGYRTGVYTSPHLVRFNERIRIDGEAASDTELCRAFERIEAKRSDVPLTYFEFATLAAVDIFRARAVQAAVMEVGMGGRLDAVNALPVDAALITNVDLDHMHWLGRDRETIGAEKARVMRGGRPAVFNHGDAPRAVLDYAKEIDARLLLRGRDYRCRITGDGWCWHGPRGEAWRLPRPPIPGAVQVDNAAGALSLLAGMEEPALTRDTAAQGLAASRLHGRCEVVARDPMVIVDVAHNLSAIAILKEQLKAEPVTGRTAAVFGMLKDKEPAGVAQALDELVHTWHIAGIRDERGQSAGELAGLIAGQVAGEVHDHSDAVEAYEAALANASAGDRIVVFGSFHIAGDILDYMKRMS